MLENLALSLAGEVIQAESDQEYAQYIQQHILQPLALTDTRPYYPKNCAVNKWPSSTPACIERASASR